LINKIDLPLYKRIFIDEVIKKANSFADKQQHSGIAYCCYISYQWYKISCKNNTKDTIIINYIFKKSHFRVEKNKLIYILSSCKDDIKNCYDDNI